ncbi:MAG: hypothetical protein LUC33_04550, partial [Prevotellaceae bacterium]|nr:hypothetical protein [Prevotellaceae bacterium]
MEIEYSTNGSSVTAATDSDWLTATASQIAKLGENPTVKITAEKNSGTEERSGVVTVTVTFASPLGYTYTKDFTIAVTQAASAAHTFSIETDPSDATVTINGVKTDSVEAVDGTEITWTVERSGYVTQSGAYVMGASDYTLSVSLDEVPEYFNVLDYGATADGTTDDTGAFDSALAAAVEYGAYVLVPSGTYYLGSTLYLDDRDMKLQGEGGSVLTGKI